MATRPKVALTGLSTGFTTRKRGEEAYEKLLPELLNGPIVLDLDGTDVLSTSFLDGLLLQLKNDDHIGNVVFATSDPLTKIRLERLGGARSVDIRLMNARGIARLAKKRAPYVVRPILSETKAGHASVATME